MPATILCADDDRGFCQILSRAFTQAGYQVEMAHDGLAAIERAKSPEARVDDARRDAAGPRRLRRARSDSR